VAGTQEKENSVLGASPEKVTDRTRDPERTGQVEETKFSQVSSHKRNGMGILTDPDPTPDHIFFL
jgi:hypothetical protein